MFNDFNAKAISLPLFYEIVSDYYNIIYFENDSVLKQIK